MLTKADLGTQVPSVRLNDDRDDESDDGVHGPLRDEKRGGRREEKVSDASRTRRKASWR